MVDEKACHRLGLMQESRASSREEILRAVASYEKACRFDIAESCLRAGNIYNSGKIVSKIPSVSSKFYDKGCKLGNKESCKQLGRVR